MAYQGPAAAQLAQAGRNEDNALLGGEVAHISAAEADLLKSLGGAGTINPVTGLRQYDAPGVSPAGPSATGQGSLGLGVTGQGQSAPPPGQAPTSPGAGFYGGPLPPGFSQVGYGPPGTFSATYGMDQLYPGRTIGEKIFLYQQRFGTDPATGKGPSRAASIAAAASPISQGIGSLSPGPTTDVSTFRADAQQLATSFGIPIQDAIISLATSRGLNPDQFLSTPDTSTFLADAQQLATSDGIPIQQAIISLAASRGLDPNQFLNVAPVGIGSIAPTSTTPPLTAPTPTTTAPTPTTPPATGGIFPQNVIVDSLTAAGLLPST
jgi:hypothetical protein